MIAGGTHIMSIGDQDELEVFLHSASISALPQSIPSIFIKKNNYFLPAYCT
jgi:hypothetical protein